MVDGGRFPELRITLLPANHKEKNSRYRLILHTGADAAIGGPGSSGGITHTSPTRSGFLRDLLGATALLAASAQSLRDGLVQAGRGYKTEDLSVWEGRTVDTGPT